MRLHSIFTLFLITTAIVAFSACRSTSVEKNPDDTEVGSEVINVIGRQNGEFTDPDHGKELALWYGAIAGVGASKANGVVYMHKFENGVYQVLLNLNISQLSDSKKKYVGWLMNGQGKTVRGATVDNVIGDSRHAMRFETRETIDDYTKIAVTIENTDTAQKPSAHVAEGELKKVGRPA